MCPCYTALAGSKPVFSRSRCIARVAAPRAPFGLSLLSSKPDAAEGLFESDGNGEDETDKRVF